MIPGGSPAPPAKAPVFALVELRQGRQFRIVRCLDRFMNDSKPDDSSFTSLGKFDYINAEHILKRFEQAGVRFRLNEDDSPLRNMGPFRASLGGGFGTEQFIEIFTHQDDDEKVRAVMSALYPV